MSIKANHMFTAYSTWWYTIKGQCAPQNISSNDAYFNSFLSNFFWFAKYYFIYNKIRYEFRLSPNQMRHSSFIQPNNVSQWISHKKFFPFANASGRLPNVKAFEMISKPLFSRNAKKDNSLTCLLPVFDFSSVCVRVCVLRVVQSGIVHSTSRTLV